MEVINAHLKSIHTIKKNHKSKKEFKMFQIYVFVYFCCLS